MNKELHSCERASTERRRYARVKTCVQLELGAEGGAPLRTEADEIALAGCYIETMFTLRIGTNVTLTLWIDDEKVSTSGRVVTRFPQVGNGIEFAHMHPEDQARLNRFIAEHLVEQQPELKAE